jgi:DNA-binding CsgD family transcriptional regulator
MGARGRSDWRVFTVDYRGDRLRWWCEERCAVTAFSDRMVPEVVQTFWVAMQRGEFITDAAAQAGTYRKKGARWLVAAGGVRPRRGRDLKGRCLSFAEREEIALGRAGGESMRSIAARLGRSPSTINRELGHNRGKVGRYRASTAHALAYERAGRPKPAKLATNLVLRGIVEQDLSKKYSPEQIAGRLRVEFPDDPEMRVSHATIYQSLYVQSRGALRRELTAYLRTGWILRRPSRKAGQRRNRIPDMVNISARPPEVTDRAVPVHCRTHLRLHHAGAPAQRLHPRAGPRRPRRQDPNTARGAARITDLGPRPRNARLEADQRRRRIPCCDHRKNQGSLFGHAPTLISAGPLAVIRRCISATRSRCP